MMYSDYIVRIGLSVLLGFLIGLERQLTGHLAGIRINVLICMGTCFFTLFPLIYGSDEVFRVGSSIISGSDSYVVVLFLKKVAWSKE